MNLLTVRVTVPARIHVRGPFLKALRRITMIVGILILIVLCLLVPELVANLIYWGICLAGSCLAGAALFALFVVVTT